MGDVVGFPRRHHAATSAGLEAANVSNVISGQPHSPANLTSPGHCLGGMPRSRQEDTVDLASANPEATLTVPPSASITSSAVIMEANIVRDWRTSQVFPTRELTEICERGDIDVMGITLAQQKRIFPALRLALGFEAQNAFAKRLGIAKNTWNGYETGDKPITIGTARRIKAQFGISLDVIMDGELQKLPNETYAKLLRYIPNLAA